MGVVYSGRREGRSDSVAIKIVRPGVDADRFLNRFRREIQVLEQLRHPGIAAFHGAGEARIVSPAGEVTLPYLVMELVDGEPVLAHAEQHSLSDRDRIELVVRIASALHHAHERGVVHRDLKPANVLVVGPGEDKVGQPKLLDFGVALAVDTDLATLTATQTGALVGTLPYMSPEQVRGEGGPVDRRSDVYSLGVLAFELLSGRLPYPVRDCPLVVAARVIQEEDPTRLGSVVTRHRGALELIVGKALEKDPSRRYPTAAAFADDLERFLRGESVRARPVTKLRELRKLARRHRVLFATSLATFLALSIGLGVSLWFATGEATARRLADDRALEANRNLYRASLQTASDAIAAGDAGLAALELSRAPEALRGWEWRILEARTDTSLMRFDAEGRDPAKWREVCDLAFGRDGRSLTLLDAKGCIHWDLASGEPTPLETPRYCALDPYGERWAQLAKGELVISSIPANERLASVEVPAAASLWGHLIFLEEVLLFQTREATYRIDTTSGDLRPFESLGYYRRWSMDAARRWIVRLAGSTLRVFESETEERSSLGSGWIKAVVSPDGRYLAGVAEDRRMTTWHLESGKAPRFAWRRRSERNLPHVLSYSPDSKLLATAGVAPSVDVWDAASSERLFSLTGHRSVVRALGFSPDSDLLAAVAQDGDVRIWQIGDSLEAIPAGRYLYAAAFDPLGERFLVGNNQGELRIYDALSSSEIGRLDLGSGIVQTLDVHADTGRCVVTVGGPARSLVLDLATATVLWSREQTPPGPGFLKAVFSPDGAQRHRRRGGRPYLDLGRGERRSDRQTSAASFRAPMRALWRGSPCPPIRAARRSPAPRAWPSSSSTPRPWPSSVSSGSTATGSCTRRSARTDRSWRRPRGTTAYGYGAWSRTSSSPSWRGTPSPCTGCAGRPTARGCSRPPAIRRSAFGTRLRGPTSSLSAGTWTTCTRCG